MKLKEELINNYAYKNRIGNQKIIFEKNIWLRGYPSFTLCI